MWTTLFVLERCSNSMQAPLDKSNPLESGGPYAHRAGRAGALQEVGAPLDKAATLVTELLMEHSYNNNN
jgi:hypothetical protein